MVATAPMAALATMMQTPRPPCSAPHRPSRPGRREFLRPVELRGPAASRPPPLRPLLSRAAPSRAAPSRAAPSRAAPSRAAPSRAAPSRASRGWATVGRVPAGCIRGGRADGFTPGWAGRPRVCAPLSRSPPRTAGGPWFRPSPRGSRGSRGPRGSESRPPWPGSRPRGSDPRASPQPESREGGRGPAAGVRATPGGGQGSPRGLAPGSPPYGLLGRASRHSGLLICASDVSRCALVTEP
jgi:hypothetical protein